MMPQIQPVQRRQRASGRHALTLGPHSAQVGCLLNLSFFFPLFFASVVASLHLTAMTDSMFLCAGSAVMPSTASARTLRVRPKAN
jgi:hypothetical protein